MTLSQQIEEVVSPGPMTEEEFVSWNSGRPGKAEWVDGKVFMMMTVAYGHDRLQWCLRNLLQFYAEPRGLGRVLGERFTVRLPRKRLEPDISFISAARSSIITRTYIDGPPDLVVEIVLPESESRDWREEYNWYEAAGVKEYWVVDPSSEQVEAYSLDPEGHYQQIQPIGSGPDAKIISRAVTGWWVKPAWLWQHEKVDVRNAVDEISRA